SLTFRERQVAQRGDVSRHHQRGAVGEIHRGPFSTLVDEPPRRAVRHSPHVAPRPARSVEYDAARAPAPANAEADPQERGRELRGAVAPELRRGGRRAVLAIAPGVATPNWQLRAPAPLHLAEEVLRSRRHETGIGEATGELLDVRNHALVQEGVVARSAAEQ